MKLFGIVVLPFVMRGGDDVIIFIYLYTLSILYVYVVDAIRFLNKPCNCTELNFGIRNNATAICKIDLFGSSNHLVKLLLGWQM